MQNHEGSAGADTSGDQYTEICGPYQGARRALTESSAHVHEESVRSEGSDRKKSFTFPNRDPDWPEIAERPGASGEAFAHGVLYRGHDMVFMQNLLIITHRV